MDFNNFEHNYEMHHIFMGGPLIGGVGVKYYTSRWIIWLNNCIYRNIPQVKINTNSTFLCVQKISVKRCCHKMQKILYILANINMPLVLNQGQLQIGFKTTQKTYIWHIDIDMFWICPNEPNWHSKLTQFMLFLVLLLLFGS